jgi:hypothetical protein
MLGLKEKRESMIGIQIPDSVLVLTTHMQPLSLYHSTTEGVSA